MVQLHARSDLPSVGRPGLAVVLARLEDLAVDDHQIPAVELDERPVLGGLQRLARWMDPPLAGHSLGLADGEEPNHGKHSNDGEPARHKIITHPRIPPVRCQRREMEISHQKLTLTRQYLETWK